MKTLTFQQQTAREAATTGASLRIFHQKELLTVGKPMLSNQPRGDGLSELEEYALTSGIRFWEHTYPDLPHPEADHFATYVEAFVASYLANEQ